MFVTCPTSQTPSDWLIKYSAFRGLADKRCLVDAEDGDDVEEDAVWL